MSRTERPFIFHDLVRVRVGLTDLSDHHWFNSFPAAGRVVLVPVPSKNFKKWLEERFSEPETFRNEKSASRERARKVWIQSGCHNYDVIQARGQSVATDVIGRPKDREWVKVGLTHYLSGRLVLCTTCIFCSILEPFLRSFNLYMIS